MRSLHAQRGTALVEFGIAASLVFIVLLGIVQFGNALSIYNLVSNAARLGTRYAIVRGSTCTFAECPVTASAVQTYVRSVTPNVNSSSLTVTTAWSADAVDGCNTSPYQAPGCLVSVTVSYPLQAVWPLNAVTISNTSQMVISR